MATKTGISVAKTRQLPNAESANAPNPNESRAPNKSTDQRDMRATNGKRAERLLTLSGLVLVVIAILCNAYWQDAVRWDQIRFEALTQGNDDGARQAATYVSRAKLVFRVGTFLALTVMLSITCSVVGTSFLQLPWLVRLGELLMILVFLALIVAFVYFAFTPEYFVPVESSDLLFKQ